MFTILIGNAKVTKKRGIKSLINEGENHGESA